MFGNARVSAVVCALCRSTLAAFSSFIPLSQCSLVSSSPPLAVQSATPGIREVWLGVAQSSPSIQASLFRSQQTVLSPLTNLIWTLSSLSCSSASSAAHSPLGSSGISVSAYPFFGPGDHTGRPSSFSHLGRCPLRNLLLSLIQCFFAPLRRVGLSSLHDSAHLQNASYSTVPTYRHTFTSDCLASLSTIIYLLCCVLSNMLSYLIVPGIPSSIISSHRYLVAFLQWIKFFICTFFPREVERLDTDPGCGQIEASVPIPCKVIAQLRSLDLLDLPFLSQGVLASAASHRMSR